MVEKNSVVPVDHIFWVHSIVDGRLWTLAIVSSTALDIGVQTSLHSAGLESVG